MSLVTGKFQEYPGSQDEAERSSNRAPIASTRSARRPASLAGKAPLRPIKPSDSGSVISMQPMPLGDEITGMASFLANSVSSRLPPPQRPPRPAEKHRLFRPQI